MMKRFSVLTTALAALFAAGIQTAAAQSFGGSQASYSGWTGTTPAAAASASDTDSKTVYLYNVDENAFVTRGGRWGTEAVLGGSDDLVLPFYVVASDNNYRLQTQATRTDVSTSSNYYLGFTGLTQESTTPSVWDKYNFFTDISSTHTYYTTYAFSAVSGETNTYRLSLTLNSTSYYVQGTKYRNTNSTSTEGRDNYVTVSTVADSTGTKWKLVTLKEIKDYAEQVTSISVQADPVTYVIADPDYARNDNAISSWKNKSGTALTQGWSGTTPTGSWTYYVGNGLADNQGAGQDNYGGTMAANIYGQGKIYQTITTSNLPRKGWYEVSCNLVTNDGTVKLYASVGGSTTSSVHQTKYAEKVAQNHVDITPATFLRSAQLVDSTQTDANGNTTYVYRVICSVYIDESNGSLESLEIGVDASVASTDAWTVVDNWQLRYLGSPESIVILDETKTSVDYLTDQNKESDGTALTTKSTVYMHRSLTADKWNTLVLPFDLSAQAITSKFGSGTIVAEFKGAKDENNPHVLYFENSTTIKKGQLYLIKPMVGEPSNGSDVTVTSSHDSSLTLTDKFYRFESVNFGGSDATFPDVVTNEETGKEINEGTTNLYFVGTYIAKTKCLPTGSYFLLAANQQNGEGSNGLWRYLDQGDWASTLGLRGWLAPKDPTQTASAKFHVFSVDFDEVVDEIDGVKLDTIEAPAVQGIFNLNGQRVGNGQSTAGLPKGLYIVNGKKMVIK